MGRAGQGGDNGRGFITHAVNVMASIHAPAVNHRVGVWAQGGGICCLSMVKCALRTLAVRHPQSVWDEDVGEPGGGG